MSHRSRLKLDGIPIHISGNRVIIEMPIFKWIVQPILFKQKNRHGKMVLLNYGGSYRTDSLRYPVS